MRIDSGRSPGGRHPEDFTGPCSGKSACMLSRVNKRFLINDKPQTVRRSFVDPNVDNAKYERFPINPNFIAGGHEAERHVPFIPFYFRSGRSSS